MHGQACCCDEAANHQLFIAAVFWTIQIVSAQEYSSLPQNLLQIPCSPHSVVLNVMATQYTCSLNGIYHPHWLGQWSCHSSHMCFPVHSPWLPGDINVMQTILVILTMAAIFLDRPGMFQYSFQCSSSQFIIYLVLINFLCIMITILYSFMFQYWTHWVFFPP